MGVYHIKPKNISVIDTTKLTYFPLFQGMNMHNKKNATILTLTATLLSLVTTISLTPINMNASTEGTHALDKRSTFSKDGDEKTSDTKSKEHSSDATAEVNIDQKHNVDKEDDDARANLWDRTINTPNKDIDVSGSSNEESSNASSKFECFACFGGV